MRLVMIGTGFISKLFAEDMKHAPNCQLHGVVSRTMESAQSFCDQYAPLAKAFTDLDEAMEGADAVYIASPHPMHKETAERAILAGKAVLCEKPLTMNLKDSEDLYAFAKKHGVLLMEAMWTAFFPAIIKLQEIIKDGKIGDIRNAQADFQFFLEFDSNHRLFNPELGGGALLDLGVYPIVISQFVYGAQYPDKITSELIHGASDVDEQGSFTFTYSDGSFYQGAFGLQAMGSNEARIYGSQGSIRIPQNFWHPHKLEITFANGDKEILNFEHPGIGLHYELVSFAETWEKGLIENPIMTHSHSLQRARLVEDIFACAKK
ncbi:Predicted dehydrogenase [Lentisphaera araneosa HTCC2155]|uniref:Predicted dehydrogenase n=1 Tax=Lentisphaera araneosa HTCC2155 TaxID=313628 RepID=A6DF50_9BACT|nr:Gfo/Idh/MocA family oxidoreductase [Lentisphaera araneosa]EDM29430.1 Predicted dehydrogenase [Lentisphaera araneosa HTCC2155]